MKKFQDGCPGGYLEYRNRMILAIFNLCHCDASHQVSAQSDRVWEEMSFEEFQDGHHVGHLGYQNGMLLAILNLHVATMPPTKFQFNSNYGSGGDVEIVKS